MKRSLPEGLEACACMTCSDQSSSSREWDLRTQTLCSYPEKTSSTNCLSGAGVIRLGDPFGVQTVHKGSQEGTCQRAPGNTHQLCDESGRIEGDHDGEYDEESNQHTHDNELCLFRHIFYKSLLEEVQGQRGTRGENQGGERGHGGREYKYDDNADQKIRQSGEHLGDDGVVCDAAVRLVDLGAVEEASEAAEEVAAARDDHCEECGDDRTCLNSLLISDRIEFVHHLGKSPGTQGGQDNDAEQVHRVGTEKAGQKALASLKSGNGNIICGDQGQLMDGIEETVDFWAAVHYIYGFYFEWLFGSDNKMFMETYKKKWSELSPILVDEMNRFLDDFSNSEQGLGIAACMQYDAHRWGYTSKTLSAEIENNKQWFTNRKLWLDEHCADIRSPWKIYTATFYNVDAWEKVYAYVENDNGKVVQKPLGDWPGTELRKNEETGLYNVMIEDIRMPESIVFNDGTIEDSSIVGVNKTEIYIFENNKEYNYNKDYNNNNLLAISNIQQREQKESIIYNLNGQRVRNAVKGLYILNGKVVLMK